MRTADDVHSHYNYILDQSTRYKMAVHFMLIQIIIFSCSTAILSSTQAYLVRRKF